MSLHPHPDYPIPEETARVARAAFPQGTLCLHLVDILGSLYRDEQFAPLFATRGQPGLSPARLALVLVLQYVENLADRQAAAAVRSRIDWKYALGLELTDPGFDASVLSEFRTRLVEGQAERLLLDTLLTRLRELALVQPRGRQRTDSTHVLAAVRTLNRLERVGETLRAALNALAVAAPDWLAAQTPPDWYPRYGRRVEGQRLPPTDTGRQELALTIGQDGQQLLAAIDRATEHAWLGELPAVRLLRQVWAEQYEEREGSLRWRTTSDVPSAVLESPYDPEAQYCVKNATEWVGYKVHLTETCDEYLPRLITHVETTTATTQDDQVTPVVQEALAHQDLLPAEHLVDKGYTTAAILAEGPRRYGVTVLGPITEDPSWQAREGTGFDKGQFRIDWNRQVVTCPVGRQSRRWTQKDGSIPGVVYEVAFAREDCSPCPFRPRCTKAQEAPRILRLHVREEHEALQARREEQKTEAFQARYAARAGIESTQAQAIRRCGLRRCRYLGLAKTHLQHVLTAGAINVIRLGDWWEGHTPAPTRRSRFAALQALAPAC